MQPERSTWNVYVSPLGGLPMYVRRDVDEDRSTYGRRVAHEMTRSYYGRPRYRINVKPKQRPQTVWYDSKGEHIGGMPIREYLSPETLRKMWGEMAAQPPEGGVAP